MHETPASVTRRASARLRVTAAALTCLCVLIPASRAGAGRPPSAVAATPPVTVGIRVLRLVDTSRSLVLRDGRREPRVLPTYVRYPALGAGGHADVVNAPAAHAAGPLPLIVFAHGFAVTPRTYSTLLQSWTRAGYVVAAPVFPLENADAPGGPNESDLVNEPSDVSFVISRLLAASGAASGPLAGLIDPSRIVVAGHSDGGETALAVGYSRRFRDRRVRATVVLSGARMGGVGGFDFAPGGPALLAAQGTADPINDPRNTYAYFAAARRPKFLLKLLGAEHLPPYTDQQPQLAIVERATVAFLDAYLAPPPVAFQRLLTVGTVRGAAALVAEP